MTLPIIITGQIGERRFIQFWGDVKVAGITSPYCLVEISDPPWPRLRIDRDCPTEWLGVALDAFVDFNEGILPDPTHTVTFQYSKPMFELIEGSADAHVA